MASCKSVHFSNFVLLVELLMSAYDISAAAANNNNIDATVFTVVKSAANEEFCDVGASLAKKVLKLSSMRCAAECQQEGDLLACRGYNYLSGTDGNICELHSGDDWPMFGMKQGCKYYTRGPVAYGERHPGLGPNRALNQPSTQVSTYGGAVSSAANDGNYQSSSCTSATAYPWWSVDLGNSSYVTAVNVTNDNNAYFAYRLDNFLVWLSNTKPTVGKSLNTTTFTLCHQYKGSVPPLGCAKVSCPYSPLVYRYVIIQSSWAYEGLCLIEVQVFTA